MQQVVRQVTGYLSFNSVEFGNQEEAGKSRLVNDVILDIAKFLANATNNAIGLRRPFPLTPSTSGADYTFLPRAFPRLKSLTKEGFVHVIVGKLQNGLGGIQPHQPTPSKRKVTSGASVGTTSRPRTNMTSTAIPPPAHDVAIPEKTPHVGDAHQSLLCWVARARLQQTRLQPRPFPNSTQRLYIRVRSTPRTVPGSQPRARRGAVHRHPRSTHLFGRPRSCPCSQPQPCRAIQPQPQACHRPRELRRPTGFGGELTVRTPLNGVGLAEAKS